MISRSQVKKLSLYTFFAILSIFINITSQIISIFIYKGPFFVEISIFVGTAIGMPVRYLLEKKYIFHFTSRDIAHDGKLFIGYTAMGVVTTFVFWATEYAFHLFYDTEVMRYAGGIVGLTIGFYIKYQLDKRYVFVKK